jgi:curved DNA-binding protein CbpA
MLWRRFVGCVSPCVEKFVAAAMDARKDYYAALGLLPDADDALIKAAYRVLAKKYHPDTAGDADPGAKQKFLQIKEAYVAA